MFQLKFFSKTVFSHCVTVTRLLIESESLQILKHRQKVYCFLFTFHIYWLHRDKIPWIGYKGIETSYGSDFINTFQVYYHYQ